ASIPDIPYTKSCLVLRSVIRVMYSEASVARETAMSEGLKHRDPPLWRGKGWWKTPRRGGHLNSPAAPAPGRGVPINTDSPEGAASSGVRVSPLRGSRIESTRVPGAGAAGLFKWPPLRGVSSKQRKISSGVAGYSVWGPRIRNRIYGAAYLGRGVKGCASPIPVP